MNAMLKVYEPEILVQTVLWVFRAYRAHGFQTCYWPANLDTFAQIAQQRLSPATYAAVDSFLQWLIVNIPVFVAIRDAPLAEPLPPEPNHRSDNG